MLDAKDSERLNRVETRLTKLMVFLGCDPYNMERLQVDHVRKIIILRDKSVTMFEVNNIMADAPKNQEYAVIINGEQLGRWIA